jgi:surface antigen
MQYQSLALATLCFGLLAAPVLAQINPFKDRNAKLSATDLELFDASVDRLNHEANLAAGAKSEWSNPATASHGLSTVRKVFFDGKYSCHLLGHEIYAEGRETARTYDLTWCRAPDGKWKIKS